MRRTISGLGKANGALGMTRGRVLRPAITSMDFVLQQNPDLTTTNWTEVTNTPTLNFTNLQNQVTLSTPSSSRFYRLKH